MIFLIASKKSPLLRTQKNFCKHLYNVKQTGAVIEKKKPTYCPNCGKIWDNGYNGTCRPYKDPFTNK